jgi:tetratricopeptide (TPR) repeat protein
VAAATLAPESRRRRIALAILLAIGALSQGLILSQQLAEDPLASVPINDARVYWQWAGDVAAGKLVGSTPFLSAPLYPYLAGLLRALGGGFGWLVLLQSALHLATVALLFRTAERRFGFAAGVVAAGLYLLLLEPAYATGRVLNSTLQLFLVVVLWERWLAAAEEPSRSRAAAVGAVLGLNVLANPAMLAAVPVVLLGLAWSSRWRPALLAAAVAVLAIAPATLHNWLACREVVLVSGQGGVTFFQGNAPGAVGVYCAIPGISADRLQQNVDARALASAETDGSWGATSRFFLRKGLAYWASDPAAALHLLGRKIWYFASGRVYGDIYVPEIEREDSFASRLALAPLPVAWLVLPALAVLLALLREPRRYLPEALLVLAPLATVAVFWYSPRYRLPALPLVAALAAHALVEAASLRSTARTALVGAAFLVSAGSGWLNRRSGFDAAESLAGQYQHSIGAALIAEGRFPEAEDRFRAALRDGWAPAAPALADVLRREGRAAEALEMLRAEVERDPSAAYAHKSLAVALAETGAFPEAEREFRATLAIDPNDWEARSGLGNVLAKTGREDEAIEEQHAALARNPGYAVGHYNLGCLLLAQDRIPEAEAEFREALRLEPGLEPARVYLAQIRGGRH